MSFDDCEQKKNSGLNTPLVQAEPLSPDVLAAQGDKTEKIFVKHGSFDWDHAIKVSTPHVAILLVVLMYILVGAIIFHKLEYDAELSVKRTGILKVEEAKREFELLMWDLSVNLPYVQEYEWQISVQKALVNFSETIFVAMRDNYLEHSELFGGAKRDLWNYEGAILFAFAVITTIGYGNITPVTRNGRIFCIFYSFFGIPLSMLAIANVGKFLAEAMTYVMEYRTALYFRIHQKIYNSDLLSKICHTRLFYAMVPSTDAGTVEEEQDRDRPIPVTWLLLIVIVYLCVAAGILPLWEDLDFFTAFYFSFITITTTGLGDIVPQSYAYLPLTLMFLGFGIAITTMCVELASNYMRRLHYSGRPVSGTRFARVQFGGKTMTVAELMDAVGRRYGISQDEIKNFVSSDFDNFIEKTIDKKLKKLVKDEEPKLRSREAQTEEEARDPEREHEKRSLFNFPPAVLYYLLRPLERFNLFNSFNLSRESIPYIDDNRTI